jgi:hypothetical protein
MSENYWEECLAESLDEHGVTATKEQLALIAKDVAGAHECYGMSFHQPENPLVRELDVTRAALKREQEKVGCKVCKGSGRIISHGPYHSSNSQCDKCHGEGKHQP